MPFTANRPAPDDRAEDWPDSPVIGVLAVLGVVSVIFVLALIWAGLFLIS